MMLKKFFFFIKTKQIYQHSLQIERQAGTCLTAEERPPRRPGPPQQLPQAPGGSRHAACHR